MSDARVAFDRSGWWLGVFLVVVAVQIATSNLVVGVWDLGPDLPVFEVNALWILFELALVAAVWWFLQMEGVQFAEIGLSAELLGPAVVAVAAFYLALNAVVGGLGALTAGPEVVGYQWEVPPSEAVLQFVQVLVVAGIVEELVFRGYVQSKVIALLGGDSWVRASIGIATASGLFALSHVARVLASGVPGTQAVAGYAGILVLSGLGYGVLYELTQNLYLPILVHAAGNMPGTIGIVFFDLSSVPSWASVVYPMLYLALFAIVIVGYRRWASSSGRLPVWTTRSSRRERASS